MKKIVLDKSAVLGLVECMNRNLDRLHTVARYYVPDPEAAQVMQSKIDEMRYYLKGVYDPELAEMKARLRLLYQKWLVFKKNGSRYRAGGLPGIPEAEGSDPGQGIPALLEAGISPPAMVPMGTG